MGPPSTQWLDRDSFSYKHVDACSTNLGRIVGYSGQYRVLGKACAEQFVPVFVGPRYIGPDVAASYRRLPPSGPQGPFKARTPARPDGAVKETARTSVRAVSI